LFNIAQLYTPGITGFFPLFSGSDLHQAITMHIIPLQRDYECMKF
jgi:hypothetical protein